MTRRSQIKLFLPLVNFIVSNHVANHTSHILLLLHSFAKEGNAAEFSIRGVVVPRHGRDGVFGLEKVSDRRVVHNNDVFHASAQSGQVFDKGVVVKSAVFTEEEVGAHLCWV